MKTKWLLCLCAMSMCTAIDHPNPCESEFGVGVQLNNVNLGTLHPNQYPVNLSALVCLDLKNSGLIALGVGVFHQVTRLRTLIIRKNSLETLHYSLFSNLHGLEILDLSYNRLVFLTDPRLFMYQIRLKELELSHNKLTVIDAQVLGSLLDLKMLNLIYNPFICDCDLRFTMMWCNLRQIYTGATCNEPFLYSGLPWTVLGPTERCKDLPLLKNLSKSNAELTSEKKETELEMILLVVGISIALLFLWCSLIGFCLWKKLSKWRLKGEKRFTYDDVMRNEDYYYEYGKHSAENRKKPVFVKSAS
ncbi:slit homolog 2 protein-like [Zootermopsis nevadensis]|nr:slit homolog 2 protein-like [Zootermopsis nevadensis]